MQTAYRIDAVANLVMPTLRVFNQVRDSRTKIVGKNHVACIDL